MAPNFKKWWPKRLDKSVMPVAFRINIINITTLYLKKTALLLIVYSAVYSDLGLNQASRTTLWVKSINR